MLRAQMLLLLLLLLLLEVQLLLLQQLRARAVAGGDRHVGVRRCRQRRDLPGLPTGGERGGDAALLLLGRTAPMVASLPCIVPAVLGSWARSVLDLREDLGFALYIRGME